MQQRIGVVTNKRRHGEEKSGRFLIMTEGSFSETSYMVTLSGVLWAHTIEKRGDPSESAQKGRDEFKNQGQAERVQQ